MTSFIGKDGNLAFRLSQEDIAAVAESHGTKLMQQHGKILKDFICIPENLINDQDLLAAYFQKSLDHTNGLKPKKK